MRRFGFGFGFNQLSIVKTIILNFKSRITTDSGTFEAESCLDSEISSLRNSGFYDIASLILTPNAYKVSKIYTIKPTDGSGDLVFTRASNAMRRNTSLLWETVSNNIPRLQFPLTGCPFWLFEPQKTKLTTRSNDFASADWTKTRITPSTSSDSSPFQSVLAKRLTVNAAGTVRCLQILTGLTAGNNYVYQCWVKKENIDVCSTIISNSGESVNAFITYTFSTNLFSGTAPGSNYLVSRMAEVLNDGWVLLTFVLVIPTGQTTLRYSAMMPVNNSLTGVLNDSLLVAQIEVEEGTVATSPLITTNTTLTRVDDSFSKSGISSQIGQVAGAFYFDAVFPALGSNYLISINDGSTNNRIIIGAIATGNALTAQHVSGGVTQAVISTAFSFVPGTRYKMCAVYDSNYFALFVNGVKIGEDLSVTPFAASVSNLSRGNGGGNGLFYGNIYEIQLITSRITDIKAIELTT
jgi:hypothetical protein